MNKPLMALALIGLCWHAPAMAIDFSDWFKTPSQRAAEAHSNQDWDTLQEVAPDMPWRGVADYGKQDYAEALNHFEQVLADPDATLEQRGLAAYNAATTKVQMGDYRGAIDLFDALLEESPAHVDASHNRAIAEQLLESQQQPGQPGEGGESDSESNGPSESQPGEQDESGDSQNGEDSASDSSAENEPSGNSDSESSNASTNGDASSDEESSAQAEPTDDAEEAAAAAAAEAALASEEPADEPQERQTPTELAQPMSEREQATEQWLRRIPDDPSGLLRNKLERSHYRQYPEVQTGADDW